MCITTPAKRLVTHYNDTWANPLIAGLFTWSRGGGWTGPHIINELWCDLNVYVLAKWAMNPNLKEERVFEDYSRDVLKLGDGDAKKFRRLCLLSAEAFYRGIRSTHNDIGPMWTCDQEIGIPPLPQEPEKRERVLRDKDEAVALWTEIVSIAKSIRIPDAATQEYLVTSCVYGQMVYTLYQIGFRLVDLGPTGDKAQIRAQIAAYDATWVAYRQIKADHLSCATQFTDRPPRGKREIGALVEELRAAIGPAS